jgi:hypothetical protein
LARKRSSRPFKKGDKLASRKGGFETLNIVSVIEIGVLLVASVTS